MLAALILFAFSVFFLLFWEEIRLIHYAWGIRNFIYDQLYNLYSIITKIFNL